MRSQETRETIKNWTRVAACLGNGSGEKAGKQQISRVSNIEHTTYQN